MSLHHVQARCGQRDVLVVAGYDRPLRELFLQVLVEPIGPPAANDELVYASVSDAWRDWTNVATVTDQLEQFEQFGIEVPRSLMQAVRLDQALDAGNRVVEHHADRPPTGLAD